MSVREFIVNPVYRTKKIRLKLEGTVLMLSSSDDDNKLYVPVELLQIQERQRFHGEYFIFSVLMIVLGLGIGILPVFVTPETVSLDLLAAAFGILLSPFWLFSLILMDKFSRALQFYSLPILFVPLMNAASRWNSGSREAERF